LPRRARCWRATSGCRSPPILEVRPAELRPEEVRPDEVRLDEVRPAEVRIAEFCPIEFCPVEVRPEEVRPDEVRPDEVRPTKVRPSEDRPSCLFEVRPGEVRTDAGVVSPPRVPGDNPPLELSDVFVICHRSTPNKAMRKLHRGSIALATLPEQLRQPRDVDGDPPS
jgi:hypothetical protein